jgi:predicted phosphoribosyltransferase
VERQAGQPIDVRLAIPSLKDRAGPHPFAAIALRMNAISQSPCLAPRFAAMYDHSISARHFRLTPDVDLTRRHVLLLDDTWTSGASAHSAALTLRRAGAQRVSVMVIGRWLAAARNARFIEGRLQNPYDPRVCPVTGGECP